jgi:hypothetical protein
MPLSDEVRQWPSFSYVFGEGSAFLHCFWLLTLVVLFLDRGVDDRSSQRIHDGR